MSHKAVGKEQKKEAYAFRLQPSGRPADGGEAVRFCLCRPDGLKGRQTFYQTFSAVYVKEREV
ncbi:hypothetical protein DXA36_16575 [Eisenbergiella sp. OF01-20]|nr:hypothetical protein DXA36_16575 [Eisenbergiella sp. OF01-20]